MDTKLKNIKHSLWTKGLCLFLSTALFALSGYTFALAFRTMVFYGGNGALTGKPPAITETPLFQDLFWKDVIAVSNLTLDVQAAADTLEGAKESTVSKMVEKYLEKKANIIKGELLYVATLDYSDFSGNQASLYNGTGDEFQNDSELQKYQAIIAELEKIETSSDSVVIANKVAPLNIYAAQLIINNVKGLDFLQYEDCVRSEAFRNVSFYSDDEGAIKIKADENGHFLTFNPDISNFSYSKENIYSQFSLDYDAMTKNYTQNFQHTINYNQSLLNDTVNFKYLVKDNTTGKTIGNVESEKGLAEGRFGFAMVDGTITENGTGALGGDIASDLMKDKNNFSVYFWLENTFVPGDAFYTLNEFYQKALETSVNREIVIASAALLLSIIAFIVLMSLSGHKNTVEGIATAFIDKLPWDIHFVISGGLCAGLIAMAVATSTELWRSGPRTDGLELVFSPWLPAAIAVTIAGVGLILTELIASAVRIKKSGEPLLGKFAVVRLAVWLFRYFVRILKYLYNAFVKLFCVLTYKPKKLTKLAILIILLYVFLNVVFVLLCLASPVFVLFVIGLNAVALYLATNYARNLDKIIAASVERSEFVPEGKVPQSLSMLADSLSYTNAELNRAISKAVRDERMKTELITNVSHDLKTPLTSIITYTDLLKNLDIENGDAQKYIVVLEEKSDKLKQLIEDLIEASKVSSGNVVLNPVNLNLAELSVQAIVEATTEFEKNDLDIRFDEPDKSPIVFADSQKTHRILENLLSNARKYSAPGTRVYIRVSESEGFGVFEIKNISKEALNISTEELTERFVRGDRSRSEEGNGLGLSIAKELAVLQNGKLTISIDGDLFKAEVLLPSGK